MFELILDILLPIVILVVGLSISCKDNEDNNLEKKRRKWSWDLPWWLN